MMESQVWASEPDWIAQMLEQVQRVGLWNEPVPEETMRVSDVSGPTSTAISAPPVSTTQSEGTLEN